MRPFILNNIIVILIFAVWNGVTTYAIKIVRRVERRVISSETNSPGWSRKRTSTNDKEECNTTSIMQLDDATKNRNRLKVSSQVIPKNREIALKNNEPQNIII